MTKKKTAASIIIGIFLLSAITTHGTTSSDPSQDTLNTRGVAASVVSGTDLYAEQIQFYLAGQNCLVRQSAITDDPYILDRIPLDDIAFKNASLVVLTSNGIYPSQYIDIHVPFNEFVTFQLAVSGIVVYLSYNDSSTLDLSTVNSRSQKAIGILQDALGVELFHQDDGDQRTFMLYGLAPEWDTALRTFTSQMPKDGYFKYFDRQRLASTSYAASKHISAGLASINPYGGSLANFSVGGIGDLLGLLDFNATEVVNFLGLNVTGSETSVFDTRTNLVFVQYEGAAGGLTLSGSTYTFNAKTALGIPASGQLKPSASVWNSMFELNPVGIVGTMIDINVVTGNVTGWSLGNERLTIDSTILDTIYMASGLGGSLGIDIVSFLRTLEFIIKNVFFITSWEKTGALSKLSTNINLTRAGYEDLLTQLGLPPDLLDFFLDEIVLSTSPLALLGFNGLPYVPTGLLKAIPNIIVTYKDPSPDQASIVAWLDTDLSIKPFQETVDLKLNVTNVGNRRAWGTLLGKGTADLSDLVGGIFNIGSIDYYVRGFFVPALASSNPLDVFYGVENFLLDIGSFTEKWIVEDILPTAVYAALLAADAAGSSGRPGRNDGFMDFHEAGLLSASDPYNYIEPGTSLIIDLSDAALTGLYTPFDGENSSITTSAIIDGIQVPPSTSNNASNAVGIDGTYWEIDTASTGTSHEIRVNFTFATETGTFERSKVAAIEFRYVGYNNASISAGGNASFAIWNYHAGNWVPINNLTRNNVTINQTSIFSSGDTFRIYDGDNDTSNQPINISHYMAVDANNTVKIQLVLGNNVSTRLRLDAFEMDYLQRNMTLLVIPSQSFSYTDRDSFTIRRARSNSLYVGSQNAGALVVKQRMAGNLYTCLPGTSATMQIYLANKGTAAVTAVDVTLPLPGLPVLGGAFSIDGTLLRGTLANIPAGSSASLNLTFTVPNSEKVPGIIVSYENQTSIVADQKDFVIAGNDWYVDAYVHYMAEVRRPHLIEVNASMGLVTPSTIPDIAGDFAVNYSVSTKHASPLGASIEASLPTRVSTGAIDRAGGYANGSTMIHVDAISNEFGLRAGEAIRITTLGVHQWNRVMRVTYTSPGEADIELAHPLNSSCNNNDVVMAGHFLIAGANPANITLDVWGRGSTSKAYTKASYKGTLVPSPNLDNEPMAALVRYVPPAPLPVGEMQLTITKQVRLGGAFQQANFHVTRGKMMVVIINVTNTGTVNVGAYESVVLALRQGFTIDDNFGFDQEAFSVLRGDVAVSNLSLAPGESRAFNYTLRAEKVGSYTLGRVVKDLLHLRSNTASSNEFHVTIDEKPELVATYLGISIGVTVLLVWGSIRTRKGQARALEDFKRKDKILYDELTKSKQTYDEYLD